MRTQTILVTGGSAGIGLATAQLLARQGHTVYCIARRKANENSAQHGQIVHITGDVNDEWMLQKAIEKILAEQRTLHTVVCNAGNGLAGAVEDTSMEEARYQFETNFFGVLKTIQACLPVFRKQGFGKVIVISSIAAVAPLPFQGFYSAVKSAILTLVQSLSLEVRPFHIQCCAVLPGDTHTEFTHSRRFAKASSETTSPYSETMKRSVGKMEKDETNGMDPLEIARCVARHVNKKKCNLIVIPGQQYKIIYWLLTRLPGWLRMRIIRQSYCFENKL